MIVLAVFKNISCPKSDKTKKIFRNCLRKITWILVPNECITKTVTYLDVTLNLEHSTDGPSQKENDQIKYTNTQSNHPPSII